MNADDFVKSANFNSAGLVLLRLDNIKKRMHEARINSDYKVWIETIISFFTEIASQMDSIQAHDILDTLLMAKRNVDGGTSFDEKRLFVELLNIELELEQIFDDKGNKFRYHEDGSRALGRM